MIFEGSLTSLNTLFNRIYTSYTDGIKHHAISVFYHWMSKKIYKIYKMYKMYKMHQPFLLETTDTFLSIYKNK